MLNSYKQNITNNLKLNAVSGILVKNHEKSRFVFCKSNSTVFDKSEPTIQVKAYDPNLRGGEYYWDNRDVVVLQAMIVGEDLFLCEIVECRDLTEEIEN